MKKFILIILLNFILISKSYALIEVDITRGNLDPLPIAVSPLHVDIKSQDYKDIKIKELGENISTIIEKNFKSNKIETTKNGIANNAARTNPIKVLNIAVHVSEAIISLSLIGAINKFVKFLLHISSNNIML